MLEIDLSVLTDLNFSIGAIENLLFSAIFAKHNHLTAYKKMPSDGYFECTVKDLYSLTNISEHQQSRIIKHLEDLKLIEKQIKGIPARRFIKLNPSDQIISNLMEKGRQMREAI